MIGQIITGADGVPLDSSSNKLTESSYNPPEEVKKLFAKVQQDFQVAWSLQHRPFSEFDGYSLLERSKLDQETFAAFVGCEWLPVHKRWRWKGRKNTSRNKLMKTLSRALAGMLYPFVYARNEKNEEDKMTARVMRILIEEHLKKAGYKMKFLYMVLSALVNPAVFVSVEYIHVMQRIKNQMTNGDVKILDVVDELLSGLTLNTIPIDEILLCDYYSGTGRLQQLPVVLRVRRIPYDQARAENAGKFFDEKGKDLFDYVQAGQTRVFSMVGDNQTLFDVEWTEADRNYVQEITAYYRSEDLQVKWVGGVGMFNYKNCYNTNPFEHRRMVLVKDEWMSIPVLPIVMSGFEPIDPAGRFAYYKSGAFKEYWDDQWLNKMDGYLYDGTALDVIKPMFLSGVTKVDSTVMVPGATVAMPTGASALPFSMGSNLAAAYKAVQMAKEDLEDTMNADPVPSDPVPGVSATQINAGVQQAKLFFTCFSLMIADLIEQVGALTVDCEIQHTTIGDLDFSLPEALKAKYKTILAQGKDKGKNITNRIVFTDQYMGRGMSEDEQRKIEWGLYDKNGGEKSEQRVYLVNPYKFARYAYTITVDADKIILKSMGADKAEKMESFNVLTDPRVVPYTDQQAVVDDFAIEEFGGDDPDRYKRKADNQMLNQMMMPGGGGANVASPYNSGGAKVVAPRTV